jgi:hypothetical protein
MLITQIDFDIQVTNYGEELCFPPERVGRVELLRIFVLENSYGVFINQSTFDRLHLKPDVQYGQTPYFDFCNPPPVELQQNEFKLSRTVNLHTRREGQWVRRMFVDVDYRSDLQWDLVV